MESVLETLILTGAFLFAFALLWLRSLERMKTDASHENRNKKE